VSAAEKLEVPPVGAWSEPDGNDGADARRADTLPAPPPSRAVEGLDLTIMPGIRSAIESAERLTASGLHDAARDDVRRAFMLLGSELGVAQGVLADLLDGPLDYEEASRAGHVVSVPPPRELVNLSFLQVEAGAHWDALNVAAKNAPTRIIGCGAVIRRVEGGPGWSFRGTGAGGVQVFEHSREECDVLERAMGARP
jgi:hypothetical protein